MNQPTLFDLEPPVDQAWQRKVARFDELIDRDLDRQATPAELLELAALRDEGVRGH